MHFHGFPQQPPVFDGMPEGSFGVNMGSTVTYFYRLNEPGTYMYHCHHGGHRAHADGDARQPVRDARIRTATDVSIYGGKNYRTSIVYNDGDGSTGYNKAYPMQLGSIDHVFHELHLGVQPLPFANMMDTYAMINGRGYPDTVNPGACRHRWMPRPASR